MNKAFIFDMDGVIVNSENTWTLHEDEFHEKLFGKEIMGKMGELVGLSIFGIYDEAVKHGLSRSKQDFFRQFDELAQIVYKEADISVGLKTLISFLQSKNFKVGLVSASPSSWIALTLGKAQVKNAFSYILSLHDRHDLKHKPAPDGFLEAMKVLHATPQHTIVLEDSNLGIQAAKASGAFTIGFRQHLLKGYEQKGADIYAETMSDVIKIVEKQLQKM